MPSAPVILALDGLGIFYRIHLHERPVQSLEQAAKERGLDPSLIVRSLLFRLEDGSYMLVLMAGPGQVSWPKSRHHQGVRVKVILENCYSSDALKRIGCLLCKEAGADFVKTSTGFARGGTTIEDLVMIQGAASPSVEVKAAGGVRDLDIHLKVREAGATRFGATQTEAIMEEAHRRKGRKA